MRVVWSPLAADRVVEIARHIATDNGAAAEGWVRRLFVRVGQLERFPESGRRVPETPRACIREIVWGNYRILYRLDTAQVAILTVRHVRQVLPLDDLK